MGRVRAKRWTSEAARNAALAGCLRRCSRPACRTRDRLEFHELVARPEPLDEHRVIVLCAGCRARARRGEFSIRRMQLWKLRSVDYWDNVGAE